MAGETVDYSGDQGLPALLASAARSASAGTMLAEVAVGVAGIAAVLYWRPPAGPAAMSGAMLLLAYGCWGIADRELEDAGQSRVTHALLVAARAIAAVVGWAALLSVGFAATGIAIGRWQS